MLAVGALRPLKESYQGVHAPCPACVTAPDRVGAKKNERGRVRCVSALDSYITPDPDCLSFSPEAMALNAREHVDAAKAEDGVGHATAQRIRAVDDALVELGLAVRRVGLDDGGFARGER
jgi:hypothetical protein